MQNIHVCFLSCLSKLKILHPVTLRSKSHYSYRWCERKKLLVHSTGSLLIVWPIATLISMMWSRHLGLRRRTLHSWGWSSWSRPHPRTEPTRLTERGTEGSLVFWELLHGVGIVMMRWGSINRGPTVLWRWSLVWMVHVRGYLGHNVARWGSDWWWS